MSAQAAAETGRFDSDHPITVLCAACGTELQAYVAACSPGNSLPALYVDPCIDCTPDPEENES